MDVGSFPLTGRRAGIISLGCPKNLVDTEFLMGALMREGWTFVSDPKEADLIIVNTCAFIDEAVLESREAIEEMLACKRGVNSIRVVVAGCLVSRYGRSLAGEYPEVDLFMKPGQIPLMARWLAGSGKTSWIRGGRRGFCPSAELPRVCTTGFWSYLKISEGCENHCHYCLIPSIRGRHRSRRLEDIAAEAAGMIASGVREIIIVGQDVTRWGEEWPGIDLVTLLKTLVSIPGEYRLRLLYLYPSRVSSKLIRFMAEHPVICPYVDMPIQHASDRILRAMNRHYTRRDVSRIYQELRSAMPGAALRTTVMVGYPGEGKREFAALMKFIEQHPFENLGCFIYSPQKGTRGARFPGRVDPEVARRRYHEVMTLQSKLSYDLWSSRVGLMTDVLLEAPAEGRRDRWIGRSVWQAPDIDGITSVSGAGRPGILARVKIIGNDSYDLRAIP